MPTISSRRSNPSVTPRTMLATRARVSPWIARAVRCSAPRPTTRVPSATFTEQSSCTRSSRRPFGPWTSTCCPRTPTWTPRGIAIGFRPILDMRLALPRLPDVAEDLPPDLEPAGLPIREDPPGRGQGGHAHPAEHARDAVRRDVQPATGLRHPAQAADDPLLVRPVLHVQPEHALPLVLDHPEVLDQPLLLEDLGHPDLQLGGGHVHLLVLGQAAVPQPGQHVRDRIAHHRHGGVLSPLPGRLG